jgi:hypothetical protein
MDCGAISDITFTKQLQYFGLFPNLILQDNLFASRNAESTPDGCGLFAVEEQPKISKVTTNTNTTLIT